MRFRLLCVVPGTLGEARQSTNPHLVQSSDSHCFAITKKGRWFDCYLSFHHFMSWAPSVWRHFSLRQQQQQQQRRLLQIQVWESSQLPVCSSKSLFPRPFPTHPQRGAVSHWKWIKTRRVFFWLQFFDISPILLSIQHTRGQLSMNVTTIKHIGSGGRKHFIHLEKNWKWDENRINSFIQFGDSISKGRKKSHKIQISVGREKTSNGSRLYISIKSFFFCFCFKKKSCGHWKRDTQIFLWFFSSFPKIRNQRKWNVQQTLFFLSIFFSVIFLK